MLTRTKATILAAALAAPFLIPATVSAADPTGDCAATSSTAVGFPNAGFNAGAAATIVSGNSYYDRFKTVNASLPAGTYDIETTSYDGYTGRTATNVQNYEQYVLEFLDSSGSVIGRTGPTPDLVDGTEEASWTGAVGQVVLDRPATQIRAIHLYPDDAAINAEGGANSVQPSCVGYTPVTTSTTTTTLPSDSTTTLPSDSTTTLPSDSTTTLPSDSTTTLPSDSTTTLPSDSTTTLPSDSTTTLPSDSTTTLPSDSTTTLPSDSTTTLPSDSTTTLPSDSTTTTIQIAPPTTSSTLPADPTTTSTPTTTVAPTTTTTTTIPTVVLPRVQEVPDPDPVVANPTFTG